MTTEVTADRVEGLLRRLAPQALGAVVRRYGRFDLAEDAVQDALLAAATQWPAEGVPDNPRAWLITVSARRLTDLLRAEHARRGREEKAARSVPTDQWVAPPPDRPAGGDDSLVLLFLCCHPSLQPAAQIALTLRAVGGLTTAEIARAFLTPEATMIRRITRAKQRIKDSGIAFRTPATTEWPERLRAVLHVLYLIFNEGYASTSGPRLARVELSGEAIRLARLVHRQLPTDSEVRGLLALMLLTDARREARTGVDGRLIPLAAQDRSRWNAAQITEGVALVSAALSHGPAGPYQVQAAIAALHDEAASVAATDWPQVLALYEVLARMSNNPVVALNHTVAVAMVHGPRAGLQRLVEVATDSRIANDHRLPAVRAHLLEMVGEPASARQSYLAAAALTTSLPQRRYLLERAASLPAGVDD